MKDNLRRLNWIYKVLPYKYSFAQVTEYEVSFMIKFNSDLAKKLQKLKFSSKIEDNGFLILKRDNYRFVMT